MPINLNQSISVKSNAFKKIAHDLQGNILKSHGRDHAVHIFLRFKSAEKAKACIKEIITPNITSANQQLFDSVAYKSGSSNGRRNFLNISISRLGYGFLGVPVAKQPSDNSFVKNMRSQSTVLNDPKTSKWDEPLRTEYHALIILANSNEKIMNRSLRSLKRHLKKCTSRIHIEKGIGIRNSQGAHIEHFGYVDGISQPLLLNDKVNNGAISKNNWNPLQDLNLALVKDPGGKSSDSFGSYLVFRKLEQDVRGWNNSVVKLAKKLKIDPNFLGAQLVGRFKSGTPLIPVVPPQPGPTNKMNDFNYSSDNKGSKCPFHSHIRKTNPRGDGGFEQLHREKRHLFVRRGITYGNIGDKNVGLLFMAYNSDISDQFEFMQKNWANNADFPNRNGKPHGIDPVIGHGVKSSGQNHVTEYGKDSSKKRVKPSFGDFVKMKGGEYFFTPSISFLKSIK